MTEAIAALLGTPIPTLLVIGGIVFIFLAIFPVKIIFKQQKPTARQQFMSAVAGIAMLSGGIFLYWPFGSRPVPTPSPTPVTDAMVIAGLATPDMLETPVQDTPAIPAGEGKIAITEIMPAPCTRISGPSVNEYAELYNYGDADIDVDGWWLTTNGSGEGIPDLIVPWAAKNPGIDMGASVITDTTIVPPGRFAVIVSPLYFEGEPDFRMPYRFPPGTILLTLQNSNYLGIDSSGLLGNVEPYSVLVLYQGSENIMDTIVSTYGAPSYGSSSKNVNYDRSSDFPAAVQDCNAMERIDVLAPDIKSNWRTVENGNPGEGDY